MKKFIFILLSVISINCNAQRIISDDTLFNSICERCEKTYKVETICPSENNMYIHYIVKPNVKLLLSKINNNISIATIYFTDNDDYANAYLSHYSLKLKNLYGKPIHIDYEENNTNCELSKYTVLFDKNHEIGVSISTLMMDKSDFTSSSFKNNQIYAIHVGIDFLDTNNIDFNEINNILEIEL